MAPARGCGYSRGMSRIRAAVLAAVTLLGLIAVPVYAAGGTYYVDGRSGNDANTGLTEKSAFKTIHRAAAMVPTGSAAAGWTINVKGYADYVYRERPIPPAWVRAGTATAPIVFQATGYVPGSTSDYVKPIVSGAAIAPAAGQRWSTTTHPGVWRTKWSVAPIDFGLLGGPMQTALFQDGTKWIWEQPSLSAVASRAKSGRGGYWYDARAHALYVSAVGSPSAGTTNPGRHAIDVVMHPAFMFIGDGIDHVTVRGFEVRHSLNGVAVKGGDYAVIEDNLFTGNLLMGIQTNGIQLASGPNPSTGHLITRNRGGYNTLQFMKIDEGTQDTVVCDNEAWSNGLQGIKVQGPRAGSKYTGITSGITICRNRLHDNSFNPTGSAWTNTNGLSIANGAQKVTVTDNVVYRNLVGIHITQEQAGRRPMNGIVLHGNQIYANRRFGINFYDGATDARGATGTMTSDHDTLWSNGIGIKVGQRSRNKTITHATIDHSTTDGIRVGENASLTASATISSSILTSNGEYGICVVSNSHAGISYTGLNGNRRGSVKGSATRAALNTRPPGYLSTVAGSTTHLQISQNSYQYTAGWSGRPIGARY